MLRQKQGESRGNEEANAISAIVELVFNGWDMLETTSRATTNMRAHIRVHLEHKHEQLRRVADTAQAKSAKQVRDLMLKRTLCVTLSILLLVGSITAVVLVLDQVNPNPNPNPDPSPDPNPNPNPDPNPNPNPDPNHDPNPNQRLFRHDVEKFGVELTDSDAFGEILPSLIVTVINTVAPMLIKSFVTCEGYANPEVELRQQIGRIFLIKMLNLVFTAFTLASAALTVPPAGYSDDDYMGSCAESAAGKTYVQVRARVRVGQG